MKTLIVITAGFVEEIAVRPAVQWILLSVGLSPPGLAVLQFFGLPLPIFVIAAYAVLFATILHPKLFFPGEDAPQSVPFLSPKRLPLLALALLLGLIQYPDLIAVNFEMWIAFLPLLAWMGVLHGAAYNALLVPALARVSKWIPDPWRALLRWPFAMALMPELNRRSFLEFTVGMILVPKNLGQTAAMNPLHPRIKEMIDNPNGTFNVTATNWDFQMEKLISIANESGQKISTWEELVATYPNLPIRGKYALRIEGYSSPFVSELAKLAQEAGYLSGLRDRIPSGSLLEISREDIEEEGLAFLAGSDVLGDMVELSFTNGSLTNKAAHDIFQKIIGNKRLLESIIRETSKSLSRLSEARIKLASATSSRERNHRKPTGSSEKNPPDVDGKTETMSETQGEPSPDSFGIGIKILEETILLAAIFWLPSLIPILNHSPAVMSALVLAVAGYANFKWHPKVLRGSSPVRREATVTDRIILYLLFILYAAPFALAALGLPIGFNVFLIEWTVPVENLFMSAFLTSGALHTAFSVWGFFGGFVLGKGGRANKKARIRSGSVAPMKAIKQVSKEPRSEISDYLYTRLTNEKVEEILAEQLPFNLKSKLRNHPPNSSNSSASPIKTIRQLILLPPESYAQQPGITNGIEFIQNMLATRGILYGKPNPIRLKIDEPIPHLGPTVLKLLRNYLRLKAEKNSENEEIPELISIEDGLEILKNLDPSIQELTPRAITQLTGALIRSGYDVPIRSGEDIFAGSIVKDLKANSLPPDVLNQPIALIYPSILFLVGIASRHQAAINNSAC